jgi:hypothetical protein
MKKIRMLLGLSAALLLFVGCETTNSKISAVESYLGTPSSIKLNRPIYFVVQDQRPQEERQQDSHGAWIYTVDGNNPNEAASSLGNDFCRITKNKGITDQALHGLPSDSIPADAIVIRVNLISWYGRLLRPMATDKIMGIINPSLANNTAEGHCRFSTVLEYDGKTIDLGISEGNVKDFVPQDATIDKEGNQFSGIASDDAMAQFFKAFENQFPK